MPTRPSTSSSQTLNAALRGFAEAGSDGIFQVATGGGSYVSGAGHDARGARVFAAFAHVVAVRHPTLVALHTARRSVPTPSSVRCWRSRGARLQGR